jgi:uncharacterized spore protein YtfJ
MSERFEALEPGVEESQEQVRELMEKLLAVAKPGTVFGEPVLIGEHTVITASEITIGMGFGFGGAFGSAPQLAEAEEQGREEAGGGGYGSGGGGGGGGRPVAAIIAGPSGVRVEPIVDVTKLGLALFTAVGGMFLAFNRMRRASRG